MLKIHTSTRRRRADRHRDSASRTGGFPARWHRGPVASDAGQAAIVLVVAISVLLTTVGGVMVTNIVNNDPILTHANVQRYAYRALASGVNTYTDAINANPYLAACNTATNGSGQCAGLSYGTWSEVPDTDLGNGVVPEYYKFDNPQVVIDSTTKTVTSLQVQVVGAAGFGGTKDVYYSTVAKFVPANGFLDNVWWTNFESEGVPSSCQYWWATGYNNSGSCTPVYFAPTDTLNGPVFSNDSIFVDGQPDFGTTAPYWGATTADPSCQFVDPLDGRNGGPPNCSNAATNDMGNYNPATSSHSAKNLETIPSDNLKLGSYAQANGCYYVGPTTITLSVVGGVGKMKVLSPESATDASLDLSTNTNTCPTNGTTVANLPANGVVYVDQNPSTNPTIAGVNPFDGYQASCGGRGGGTCTFDTQTQATCPGCYQGQTSSPDTEGDVFVQGSLSGHLTISANNDVVVDGPITYADCTSWAGTAHESLCNYNSATGTTPNDVLGLIAYNYVEISRPVDSNGNVLASCNNATPVMTDPLTGPTAPLCDPATSSGSPQGAGLTIDASILGLQQSFAVNNYSASGARGGGPSVEGTLTIYGSIQQNSRGAVGTFGGGGITTGYSKDYNFDPRLAFYSPPYYLTPGTASWNLDSSAESYQGSQPSCPPAQSTPSTTALSWPLSGSVPVGSTVGTVSCTAAS